MTQTYSVDYWSLKTKLLNMWNPAVGVQGATDVVTKNLKKIFAKKFFSLNLAADKGTKDFQKFFLRKIPLIIPDCLDRELIKEIFELYVFEQGLETSFDNHPPFQLSETILAGSLAEGLFLYTLEPPDVDFMCVLKNITFSKKDQEDGCLLLRDDTPFVHAFVTNKETQNLWREFFDDADKEKGVNRLSSQKLKEKLQQNYQKSAKTIFPFDDNEQYEEISEGAALTVFNSKSTTTLIHHSIVLMKNVWYQQLADTLEFNFDDSWDKKTYFNRTMFLFDVVLSIFCEEWPACAKEWITRERLWPDIHTVEQITNEGFYIVPKSSPDGDFRLSFSCAETRLIETLMPLQHKAMRAFKAVVKYHKNTWTPNLKEIISSYHLKTIAFWHFERSSQDSWSEETLVHHLVELLEELAQALRIQNLPMYFMPKFNLLQDVDDPEITLELMEKILQLSHDFTAMLEAVNNYTTTI